MSELPHAGAWQPEIDRLRAELQERDTGMALLQEDVEALREAGEGLADELSAIVDGPRADNALARWREVTGEKEDDVGPPAPGEGDHLPNPEAEMKC
jgi:hypothetical protein